MVERIKIVCTVTNDLTYDQRMIRICNSLSHAGYAVTLVGRQRPSSLPLDKNIFHQKRLSCYFEKGKFFYIEYNIRLFFFLLFSSFDIVNSIDLDTLVPGFLTAKLKRKTCIYDAHEYFTEVPEVVRRPRIQKIWKKVESSIVPRLEYCYTVGEGLAEMFTAEYKTTFAVVRNVPFKVKDFGALERPKNKNKILLYQGALNEGRGLKQMIEAMDNIEGAVLQLAGEGDLSDELRALVKSKKLDDKVEFLGFIKPHNLKDITMRADIGLNLLENKGLSYYFSLANKAFDYIQARKPSINMNFPEYKKLQHRYGTFHLAENLYPETLTLAVQRLLNDKDYYQSLVEKCEKAAQVLIWEEEEKVLLGVYAAAVNKILKE